MSDVKKLIEESIALLQEINLKPTYSTPKRKFVYCEFLESPDFSKENNYPTAHYFVDVPTLEIKIGGVIHGHKYEEVCSAPSMCHRWGYLPSATDNPVFVKAFYDKWEHLYKINKPALTPVSEKVSPFEIEPLHVPNSIWGFQ